MINAFSKNTLLAQSFLTDFVATDDGMKLLYDALPFVPAWSSLAATIDDKDLKDFSLSVANGDPMPAIPQMASVWTAWGNAITLIYQQKEEPAKALMDAAEAIRAEIAKSAS